MNVWFPVSPAVCSAQESRSSDTDISTGASGISLSLPDQHGRSAKGEQQSPRCDKGNVTCDLHYLYVS